MFHFSPSDGKVYFYPSGSYPISVIDDPSTWYCYDASEYSQSAPMIVAAFTLCLASPKKDHYRRLEKAGGFKKIMPVWTFDELCDMARFVTPSFSVETIKERYSRFGGIPRWIFAHPRVYNSICGEQDLALRKIDIKSLSAIVDDIHALSADSQTLFAIHSNYPFNLGDVKISCLSEYVESQLFMLKNAPDASSLSMAVQSLKGTCDFVDIRNPLPTT